MFWLWSTAYAFHTQYPGPLKYLLLPTLYLRAWITATGQLCIHIQSWDDHLSSMGCDKDLLIKSHAMTWMAQVHMNATKDIIKS